jgi:2-methylcitrate dehydratase PrpD
MTGTITRQLAEFALASHKLPDEVDHAARRALVDHAGVSIAGTRHAAWHIALRLIGRLESAGRCRIIGSELRADSFNAALINGIAAHVLDFDDTILPTRAHLSAALFPPLFAEGERQGWTIGQVLEAFAIGFEISARINECVYPSVHLRGWQGTGVAGAAGAAAAIGRLIQLSEERMVHAIGIAAAGAAGPIATFGSMTKALNIGRAGALGLQSAFLAADGFTSNDDMLGAARFLDLFDDAPRRNTLVEGLGQDWAVLRNGYKPYPCGFVAHAMIEAVCELRARRGSPDGLARLALRVSQESTQLMGNTDPSNELEAKFSLAYSAAVAWVDGNVTPAAYENETVRDRRYRSVMAATTILSCPDVRQDEAVAEGTFTDGTSDVAHVEHARGTSICPMTDEDLLAKYQALLESSGIEDGGPLYRLITSGSSEPASRFMDHLCGVHTYTRKPSS